MLLKLQSSASFARRLIPSAAGIEAVFAHRAVQGAATVAALLALCGGRAQGTWRVGQPGSPAGARAGGADFTDLRARIVIVRGGAREAVLMKDAEETPGPAVAAMTPIVQPLGSDRQRVDRRQLQQQLGRPEFLSQALIVPNPGGGGFLVREVQSGSLYEKLGLRPGDVIRNVNGQPITN